MRMSKVVPAMSSVIACGLLAFTGAGCTPSVDYENVEGIEHSDDEFFRYVDYPDTSVDVAFSTVERLVRTHFAGSRVMIDRERHTLETEPRPFASVPQRITFFAQVTEREAAARVELFAKVDRLVEDAKKSPTNPWKYIGADARLENQVFEELWDALVVSKRVKVGETAPALPHAEPSTKP